MYYVRSETLEEKYNWILVCPNEDRSVYEFEINILGDGKHYFSIKEDYISESNFEKLGDINEFVGFLDGYKDFFGWRVSDSLIDIIKDARGPWLFPRHMNLVIAILKVLKYDEVELILNLAKELSDVPKSNT